MLRSQLLRESLRQLLQEAFSSYCSPPSLLVAHRSQFIVSWPTPWVTLLSSRSLQVLLSTLQAVSSAWNCSSVVCLGGAYTSQVSRESRGDRACSTSCAALCTHLWIWPLRSASEYRCCACFRDLCLSERRLLAEIWRFGLEPGPGFRPFHLGHWSSSRSHSLNRPRKGRCADWSPVVVRSRTVGYWCERILWFSELSSSFRLSDRPRGKVKQWSYCLHTLAHRTQLHCLIEQNEIHRRLQADLSQWTLTSVSMSSILVRLH